MLKLNSFDVSNKFMRLYFAHTTFLLKAPFPQLAAAIAPLFANTCLAW
jgi:hypothetical protein